MRTLAAGLILGLLASCASSPSSKPHLSISVADVAARNQRRSGAGTHLYRIRIDNRSQQMVTVLSIQIESPSPEFDISEMPQTVGSSIEPGQSASFDVYATVTPSRRSMTTETLDSVRLTISCTAETGDFFESGVYSVSYGYGQ